jgi:hypothetical protein
LIESPEEQIPFGEGPIVNQNRLGAVAGADEDSEDSNEHRRDTDIDDVLEGLSRTRKRSWIGGTSRSEIPDYDVKRSKKYHSQQKALL